MANNLLTYESPQCEVGAAELWSLLCESQLPGSIEDFGEENWLD